MENPLQASSDCSVDRLSNLPDDILGKILSFLPLKVAVGTSVLSTRWKDLWARDLSVLDLDNTLYLSGNRLNEEGDKLFRDFAVRVLNLLRSTNSSRLIKLRFHYDDFADYGIPDDWFGIKRMPISTWCKLKELDLTVRTKKYITIETRQFICSSLVSIKLDARIFLTISPELRVHLPNVKVVHLHSIIPENDSSIQQILEGCPVLEELVIARLDMIVAEGVKIHCSKLKRLTINSCQDLEIDTPNLEYLEVNGFDLNNLTMKDLSLLTEAKICACQDLYSPFEILASISQVKYLTFGIHTVEELCKSHNFIPTFGNLVRLEIVLLKHRNIWQVMHGLLAVSPILEVLIIDCYFFGSKSKDRKPRFWPKRRSCECLERLRILEVRNFGANKNVKKLIKFIRGNAKALKAVLVAPDGLDVYK